MRNLLHLFTFSFILVMTLHNGSALGSSPKTSPSSKTTNPLLSPSSLPFEAPDFAKIKDNHFLEAFTVGMEEHLREVQAIANAKEEPTFANTLRALEQSGQTLERVKRIFFQLASTDSNEARRAIEASIAPKLASHADDIYLNKKLFQRVESLWKKRNSLTKLSEEEQRLLKVYYEGFIRSGAQLSLAQQKKLRELNEQLSTLRTQYQNNLLAMTKERSVWIDDVNELEGMSKAELAQAKEAAKENGQPNKYLLVITNTTRQPALLSLKNRNTRKKLWEASANRGLGENNGIDNRPLVLKMVKLRAERAKILGYPNHAAYTLENQMAGTPAAAFKMLQDMIPGVLAKTKEEAHEIEKIMHAEGIKGPVQAWDWEYYVEKVRATKYDFDEAALKPYFELERALNDGVFYTFEKLYGIKFRERKDLPVYHESVRTYDVVEKNGRTLGIFYTDYYERPSKRGGAWMGSFVDQSNLMAQQPVVINVLNIPRPTKGEPTFLGLYDVIVLFHELGHGVHGLFSAVEYPSLSGTSVPRDFVEFPSTFHEDWAIHPEVLANYAKHYKTGKALPKDILAKGIAARQFNKGYDTLEYLSAALLDLAWHSLSPDDKVTDVEKFERDTLKKYGVDVAAIPPRYRTAYFSHIFTSGYSAGYYAYLWSEVLAADAYDFVQSQGGLKLENGQKFRDTVLSRGGSREVMQQYKDFRGVEPNVKPLLERRGLM